MRTFVVVILGSLGVVSVARADRIDDVLAANRAQAITPAPDPYPDNATVADNALAVVGSIELASTPRTVDAPCAVIAQDPEQPPVEVVPAPTLATNYEHRWRALTEIGFRAGGAPVDGVDTGTLAELVLGVGVHRDRFTALATYGVSMLTYPGATQIALTTGAAPPTGGTEGVMHRLELAGRYAIGHLATTPMSDGHDTQFVGDLFVQAGGGLEITQWDEGGRLVRPELAFEIGVLGAYRSSSARRSGLYLALRFDVARRTDLDGLGVTCAAPCTTPTTPVAWRDRAMMFEAGFLFGN